MSCLSPIDDFLAATDYSATSPRTQLNSAGNLAFGPMNLIKASEDFSDSNWTKTNTTVTSNAAAAPDGTLTADKITADTTTNELRQDLTVSGDTVVLAACFKEGSGPTDQTTLQIRDQSVGSNILAANLNLDTGAITYLTGSSGATAVQLADGWWYFKLEASHTSGNIIRAAVGNAGYVTTSGGYSYTWGAHLYENGLAGMVDVPEDQRALAALTKYLPNKAVVTGGNLVSNGTFDSNTSGWTTYQNSGTPVVSVSSGQVTIDHNSSAQLARIVQQINVESGSVYKVNFQLVAETHSASVFVGPNTSDAGNLNTSGDLSGSKYVTFYFTANASTTNIGLQIQDTNTTATATFDNITVTKVDRDPTAARFLPRSEAYEYVSGVLTGPALKAEPRARTNLFPNSTDLTSETNVTTTADYADLITGNADATLVSNTAVGAATFHYYRTSLTLTQSTTYTYSCYVKYEAGSGWIWLLGETASDLFVYFDVQNGVVGTSTGADNTEIEDVGGGVYRCSVTFTKTSATGGDDVGIGVTTGDGVTSWDSTGAADQEQVVVMGHQLEAGSTPSSLIPTYGATRTRTAETFTQKADKIVWPNTTYVDGAELVTNGTFDTDTDWTKGTNATISGGTLSYAGGSGNTDTYQSVTTTSGNVYAVSFTLQNVISGSAYVRLVGTTASTKASDGTYTIYYVSTGTGNMWVDVSADFVGDIDNISVKEINPRALCVVMHGYMTYADGNSYTEAVFWRQRADASNELKMYLDTFSTNTGNALAQQKSNGTDDYAGTSGTLYSPGINVPFKIASRHLDNAIQGAADGTSYAENTTPPGLPDLKDVQTEWFYDGDGFFVTFAGVGQSDNAGSSSRIGSTHGPQTLVSMTNGAQP